LPLTLSKAGKQNASRDPGISLRFKLGTHTVCLFVDPLAPFSDITEELLQALRERYPEGKLALSVSGDSVVPIPTDEEAHVSYAVLKNQKEPASGWRNLKISGKETPVSKSLKDNMIIAFALRLDEADSEEELFQVEFPDLDDPEEAGDMDE